MKLRGNFVFPFDRLIPALIGAGWGLAVLGTLTLVAMVFGAVRFNQETPALRIALEQLKKTTPPPATAALPSPADQENLKSRLGDLNSLGAGGGKTVAATLSRLESLLPPGAGLISFQQDRKTGEIQLAAEAENLDQLSRFLAALENDADFDKVTLTKQSRSQGKDGRWIQFAIDLSGRAE